jgi:hypothetical protein
MQMLKRFLIALAVVAVAACGGGSGGGSPFGGDAGSGGGSGGGGSGGGSGGGGTTSPSLTLTLSSPTVTTASPATVTARVLSAAGAGVANVVVSFSASTGLGTFSAPTALTNAEGVATVTLSPASSTSVGADTVVATASVAGTAVSSSVGFQLTATNVTIASFTADVGAAALTAYGQTQISVVLSGTAPGTPVNVALSSSCVSQGRATLTPASVSTSTGTATFTFRDGGCGAFNTTDSLQASVTGSAANASLSVRLTAPAVASVAFVSAEPSEIYLRGSGFAENSNITFQVRDANGLGVPNQEVSLEATTLAGGLTLDGAGIPVIKRSDVNGNVIVRINSGTVPTPVRVRATLTASNISTFSSNLAVAVGLPSQQNFSLSQRTSNIEGGNVDGTTNSYTVIASDRLSNPVPADTAINFVAEGGQVQAIRFTTITNGLASATANFQSSSPRPPDGRVTVLAYALGEESFLDTNGDNVYTPGEDYQDLGDVFLDRLFNGTYNAAEDQFISLAISGTDACNTATSALLRIGVEAPSRTVSNTGTVLNTCVSGWGRAYVRKAIQTVFSTSEARLGWRLSPPTPGPTGIRVRSVSGLTCASTNVIDQIRDGAYAASDSASQVPFFLLGNANGVVLDRAGVSGSFSFLVADANPVALNPVAAGSTITATGTEGLNVTVLGSPVANSLSPTGAAISYSFTGSATRGTITITVRSPSGLATSIAQAIELNEVPSSAPCP